MDLYYMIFENVLLSESSLRNRSRFISVVKNFKYIICDLNVRKWSILYTIYVHHKY